MLVAMRYGLARGMYANEAGYGTAAVAYGTARSRQPLDQGLKLDSHDLELMDMGTLDEAI